MTSVMPDGPIPCDLVACGEAPGKVELAEGRGWVGPAGQILWGGHDLIGTMVGRPRETVRCTNVCKVECNDETWLSWTDTDREGIYADLRAEIAACDPKVVLAFGRRACIGLVPDFKAISLDHGKPRMGYGGRYIVLPLWHPAAALRGNAAVIPQLAIALATVPDLLIHGLPKRVPDVFGVAADLLETLGTPEPTWPSQVGYLLPVKTPKNAQCKHCALRPARTYSGRGLKWNLCNSCSWQAKHWALEHLDALDDWAASDSAVSDARRRDRIAARMQAELLGAAPKWLGLREDVVGANADTKAGTASVPESPRDLGSMAALGGPVVE